MADIELVIKLSEKDIESIKHNDCKVTIPNVFNAIRNAIDNSKILPKGHGDLVDRDKINDRYYEIWKELESYSNKPTYKELLDKWSMCMDAAQPIIGADKESEEV